MQGVSSSYQLNICHFDEVMIVVEFRAGNGQLFIRGHGAGRILI